MYRVLMDKQLVPSPTGWEPGIKVFCTSYEIRPQCRMISVRHVTPKNDLGVDAKYYLAFPYMQFTIFWTERVLQKTLVNKLYVTCSNAPLVDAKGASVPCLPNIQNDLSVCRLGLNMSSIDPCWDAISSFWQSKFVENDGGTYPAYTRIASAKLWNFNKWQELTRNDPNFILKIEWPFQGIDLRTCLKTSLI